MGPVFPKGLGSGFSLGSGPGPRSAFSSMPIRNILTKKAVDEHITPQHHDTETLTNTCTYVITSKS